VAGASGVDAGEDLGGATCVTVIFEQPGPQIEGLKLGQVKWSAAVPGLKAVIEELGVQLVVVRHLNE
jgi:hypothetical protein